MVKPQWSKPCFFGFPPLTLAKLTCNLSWLWWLWGYNWYNYHIHGVFFGWIYGNWGFSMGLIWVNNNQHKARSSFQLALFLGSWTTPSGPGTSSSAINFSEAKMTFSFCWSNGKASVLGGWKLHEQCSKPWLVDDYRGFYSAIIQ